MRTAYESLISKLTPPGQSLDDGLTRLNAAIQPVYIGADPDYDDQEQWAPAWWTTDPGLNELLTGEEMTLLEIMYVEMRFDLTDLTDNLYDVLAIGQEEDPQARLPTPQSEKA